MGVLQGEKMKRFYGYDITLGEENEQNDGDIFAVDALSDGEWDKLSVESESGGIKRSSHKLWSSMWTASAVILVTDIYLLVSKIFGEELSPEISKLFFHPIAIPIHLLCAVFCVYSIIRLAKLGKSKRNLVEEKSFEAPFCKRLGIPDEAKNLDILCFDYDPNTDTPSDIDNCLNTEMKVWEQDGALYISDLESKYEIPLSWLKRIRTVDREVRMIFWNKDASYKDSLYAKYGIAKKRDLYVIKNYCELEFEHDGETWLISFPPYELSEFTDLTGLFSE